MSMAPSIEFQSPETIGLFQINQLQQAVKYVINHSPFYQQYYNQHGVTINSLQHLQDFTRIPVTTKDDLQNHNWEEL